MRTDTGHVFKLTDYKPTDFVVERIDLTFELDPKATIVVSRVILHRREGVGTDVPLVLDGDELTLDSLLIDGMEIDASLYDATPDSLTIRELPESAPFEITVTTTLSPETNTKLMGLYRTSGVYCTQCESEGFRRITYFYDRPDVLTVYTVTIIAAKDDAKHLLSNGNFLGGGNYDEGRHFAAWFDPHPKPAYLFALVGGDLGLVEDTFTTMSGREVALKIYVEHGKEPRAAYAMDALKRSMKWDEDVYGREYDLDIFQIVAVSDFNMGAMENKGLNVFNDKYVLADPETAADADYANIEAIIAHEYFHNWTGNRITCRDWFQLCLKEGLTVYRDHAFSADQRSAPVKRIAEIRLLKAHQFPEDAGPLAHPVRPETYREINNFYTATVYEKGSEVVRMIRTILGVEDFRKGMDLYFERHDGDAATIEDFLACFAEASGRDLKQFALWYSQAGTPSVSVSSEWNETKKTFKVTLEQSLAPTPGQSRKALMHIPLAYGLILPDGTEFEGQPTGGEASDGVFHLTKRKQTFSFSNVPGRPVVSINRGFSAPVNIAMEQSPEDLAHISRHESDGVARWQALNDYATRHLVAASRLARDGRNLMPAGDLADVLIATAKDDTLEPAFRAQALALPAESDIAREIGSNIDPDAIHTAREAVLAEVARAGQEVFTTLAASAPKGAYSPDAAAAGQRALAGISMSYASIAEATAERAKAAFNAADNMTVLAQALQVLAHQFPGSDETREALETFRTRYADNPLVLDKWYSIQAMAPGAETCERVEELLASPVFDHTNPNRMRSLVGAFTAGNPTGFNRADGAGYRLLARQVVEIDGRNPQLAARLLTAMRSWRSLEPGRQEQARLALLSIRDAGKLSADVSDIVERMLAA
ncbi:aminopeptidase N [Hoeflea phototrophica DFL-43]|uniref:Aminopeptidase N n=1 Tax=Hoeflea phototrophica (strain DSM 17068 / NCIMB 14078 / DFL-43) TaxID=411684 RepID=A9D414_HOEPD|nr:aminopeptidase N [Hoeflea phototrophica]EDQ33790.1 aminopeptidase N [Hoeflea phototrophica DFL-43]